MSFFLLEVLEELDEDEVFRRPRIVNLRPDYFNRYDDFDFVKRFRLTKESVMLVLEEIEDHISPPSRRNNAVPAINRLLLTLRLYATGCMLQMVADYAGVSMTSACDFVHSVTVALCRLRPNYIQMPEGRERQEVNLEFYQIAGMPEVIGTIDCTHVKLQSPGGNQAEVFRNRKGFMSLNVQTVSDAKLRIRSIVARWPGSSHDQNIFNNSVLKRKFEDGDFGRSILLGDSGYANTHYLITPLLHVNNAAENLYNESHIRTRNTVERQYGVWKRRFPILYVGARLSLPRVQAVITACAVLHNIAIQEGEIEPPQDPDVEGYDEGEDRDAGIEVILPPGNDGKRRSLIHGHFQQLIRQ